MYVITIVLDFLEITKCRKLSIVCYKNQYTPVQFLCFNLFHICAVQGMVFVYRCAGYFTEKYKVMRSHQIYENKAVLLQSSQILAIFLREKKRIQESLMSSYLITFASIWFVFTLTVSMTPLSVCFLLYMKPSLASQEHVGSNCPSPFVDYLRRISEK